MYYKIQRAVSALRVGDHTDIIWPVCNKGITQFYLPPTHEYGSAFPQPQYVTAVWLVLIAPTHEGMARLS